MPRLILLNGPPGIGKSTLAQRYADDHPGVLNLDIDLLRGLIGGWREDFAQAGAIVRPLALSMVAAHVRGGRDVIMPQYLGDPAEIVRFGAAALDNGATFRELALMDGKQRSLDRFYRRGGDGQPAWHDYVIQEVERTGGREMLAANYDKLTRVLAARPQVTVLLSNEGAIDQAYAALTAALDPGR
jgi:predicted kinase